MKRPGHRDKYNDRETDRELDTETKRQKCSDTDKDTHRYRQTNRDRKKPKCNIYLCFFVHKVNILTPSCDKQPTHPAAISSIGFLPRRGKLSFHTMRNDKSPPKSPL